jgi:hypothetical protein
MAIQKQALAGIIGGALVSSALSIALVVQVHRNQQKAERIRALEAEIQSLHRDFDTSIASKNDLCVSIVERVVRGTEPTLRASMDDYLKAGKAGDAKRVAEVAIANNKCLAIAKANTMPEAINLLRSMD